MATAATLARDRRRGQNRAATPFHALTPFTMLDFPGCAACIVWIAGCNMRCGYCHNPQIVLGKGSIGEGAVMDFLTRRRGLLDGVVLSGGEATTWSGLANFAEKVKAMGFAIKLDTNGLRPDVITRLLEAQLLDRIALDYKAPRAKFAEVTGVTAWRRFNSTLDMLCAQGTVRFEVRTTVHTDLLNEDDILTIAKDLAARGYRGRYAIQMAVIEPDRPTLAPLAPPHRQLDIDQLQQHSPLELIFR